MSLTSSSLTLVPNDWKSIAETYCRHQVFKCPSYSSKSSRFPDLVLKVDPMVTESGKFTLKSLNRFKQKVAKLDIVK